MMMLASIADIFKVGLMGTIALCLLMITIWVMIILAFLTFAAKKNSELFNYDKLAEKIAEQIMKKQIEYDRHKQRERAKRLKLKARDHEEE